MRHYRLEACSVCRELRVGICTAITEQRERYRQDRAENIGGAQVWWVDFCEECARAYEASFTPPQGEGE